MAKWIIRVGNSEFYVSDHKAIHFDKKAEELTKEQALSTLGKLADMQRISSLKPEVYSLICTEKSV